MDDVERVQQELQPQPKGQRSGDAAKLTQPLPPTPASAENQTAFALAAQTTDGDSVVEHLHQELQSPPDEFKPVDATRLLPTSSAPKIDNHKMDHTSATERLPLSLVLRNMNDTDTVNRLILHALPTTQIEAPLMILPLHDAALHMDGSAAAAECMRFLLHSYPEAVQTEDTDGFLPLHLLATNRAGASAATVQMLVDAFPQALTAKDRKGRTPLQAAEQWRQVSADVFAELRRLTEGEKLWSRGGPDMSNQNCNDEDLGPSRHTKAERQRDGHLDNSPLNSPVPSSTCSSAFSILHLSPPQILMYPHEFTTKAPS
jgi:hypothetical protein